MTMNDNLPDEDGGGFDAEDWTRLTPFVGLILPDGGGAVALMEDVDLVDATDPTWRELVTNAIDPSAAED
jgi:hypothetical protein